MAVLHISKEIEPRGAAQRLCVGMPLAATQITSDSGHHLTVQMPSGVPEHGHDKDETKERGY